MITSLIARRALLTAGVLITLVTSTYAADTDESLPCMQEIDKFCKDTQPGAGRIIECLNGHGKELAPICREKVDKALARFEEAKKICADDLSKFCGDITPGEGRLLKCMKANRGKISIACRQQLDIWGGGDVPPKSTTGKEKQK